MTASAFEARQRFFIGSYAFWHYGEGFQTVLFSWYVASYAMLSPSEIGIFQALCLAPFLGFILIGGVISDWVGPRRMFVISTSAFGLSLIGYGLMVHLSLSNHVILGAFCLLIGTLSALSNPAIDALIPVGGPYDVRKNTSLAALLHNIGKLSGTVSASLIGWLGAFGGFSFNGILMVLSSVFLFNFSYRREEMAEKTTLPARSISGELAGAFTLLCRNRVLRDITCVQAALGIFSVSAVYILWPLLIRDRIGGAAPELSLIFVSYWIGTIASSSIVAKLPNLRRPGRIGLLILVADCAVIALTGEAPNLAWAAAATMAHGVAIGASAPLLYGIFQDALDARNRTTMISVNQMAYWGGSTIGTLLLGAFVESFSISYGFLACAGCLFLCVIAIAIKGNISSCD